MEIDFFSKLLKHILILKSFNKLNIEYKLEIQLKQFI